jgi:hypothetical protein
MTNMTLMIMMKRCLAACILKGGGKKVLALRSHMLPKYHQLGMKDRER